MANDLVERDTITFMQRFSLAVAAVAEAAEAAVVVVVVVVVASVQALGRDDALSCEAERYHVHCSGSA